MIRTYLNSFNLFSEEEIEAAAQLFEYRKLNKNDCLVVEGEPCKLIAFICSGVFRSFYLSETGVDHTFCFRFPNSLMAPYSAFLTGQPSVETVQAITDAELLVIHKKQLEGLVTDNSNWTKFLKLNAEHEYLELEKRFFQLQRDSAKQRYLSLLENQPEYIQQIPLQYLASYLGVTQRHLSRIRKEISF
ncbi:Crp/Fnr family transcriptional regulator [Sphingobacterium olei]|uniref:Crp/Fnr family transcriptional regulator n=1 Tax=Sphingobacterium olei TaxID=2571155 RepID=A0A4U0P6D0_9SPHI|nr:Crp/Fnr family transcriptional regulator [Sphingobacterium olei]TJZ63016.1 Crp/Fnr family transcriptional regulator [Sphingobacterium olei]